MTAVQGLTDISEALQAIKGFRKTSTHVSTVLPAVSVKNRFSDEKQLRKKEAGGLK